MADDVLAIEVEGLSKRFGDVQANDGIDIAIRRGEIHGIVGENGAGKSTLLNMLFGLYKPDAGTIKVHGALCHFAQPSEAMAAGVGMVHQHFMLVEPFTVLENILLGAEGAPMMRAAKERGRSALLELEERFGFDLPLDTPVAELSVGVRQRTEILKALYRGADILILDEPTAVLTPQESEQLFALVRELAAQGKTVVFVTHKLGEITALTDRVTVVRAGRVVAVEETAKTNEDALAELMVGRRVVRQVERTNSAETREIVRLEGVRAGHGSESLKDVSLSVRTHEILGIAGVAGNGQTSLIEVLTGLRHVDAGSVYMGDVLINGPSRMVDPITLRRMGMAHVAEDRLKTGAVESMTAEENAILGYQRSDAFSERGRLQLARISAETRAYFERQDVRPVLPKLPFSAFSGGNQQKLVIARETAHDPDFLVVGQPTRGVDIGAVARIHDLLTDLRNTGKALLVVSADLDELLALSDRIAVMSEGRLMGILPVAEADERRLGLMMAGQEVVAAAPAA